MAPDTTQSPPSLRNRYIVFTLLLSAIIIGISLFIYTDVVNTNSKVTATLERNSQQFDLVSNIRSKTMDMYRSIDLFLLDPLDGNHRQQIHDNIARARENTQKLQRKFQAEATHAATQTGTLASRLNQLKQNLDQLIEIRLDVNRQYPAMSISAFEMGALQDEINSQLNIVRDEIENGGFKPTSARLYPLILKTEIMWAKAISQIRIYLANRFTSFSKDILVTQAESLDSIYNKVLQQLASLHQIYESEPESFEGLNAINTSVKTIHEWHRIYLTVREITESNHWREDNHIMKSSIIPLLDDISTTLFGIENHLRQKEQSATTLLKDNSFKLIILVITTIILFLLYIFAIHISLDVMIFHPISNVAIALKSKAFETKGPKLARRQSKETQHLIEAFQEMDLQVNKRQHALEHQALHDALTGLPNRMMLNERLEYHLVSSSRNKKPFALLMLDLNNFKDVNDSLGHGVGDQLLIKAGKRLTECIRDIDTVSRLGGDEFAILLPETNKEQSKIVAIKINKCIADIFTVENHTIHIGVSIGIVNYPADGTDYETLMQHADIAMYKAKRNRLAYTYYDASEDEYGRHRMTITNDLREALKNDQLELYFQPQINMQSRVISGAEALLRWQHPELGYVQPERIIEIAEHSGIINELTNWVIENAIKHCSSWHAQGLLISISVNLSVHNLVYKQLCDQVENYLKKYNFESRFLILEITENGMMANPGRSIEILNQLHDMGVHISIDDFGTGFSSLAYLKQLPVNEVKIDKSFVFDMEHNGSDATIVHSIVDLGHNLGLQVIAEGVENEATQRLLEKLGCDFAQGFLISKPMNAESFLKKMLKDYPPDINQVAMS